MSQLALRIRDPSVELPAYVRRLAKEADLNGDPLFVDITSAEHKVAEECKARLRASTKPYTNGYVAAWTFSETIGRPLDYTKRQRKNKAMKKQDKNDEDQDIINDDGSDTPLAKKRKRESIKSKEKAKKHESDSYAVVRKKNRKTQKPHADEGKSDAVFLRGLVGTDSL